MPNILERQRAAPGDAQAFVTKADRWPHQGCLLWPYATFKKVRNKKTFEYPLISLRGKTCHVRVLILEMQNMYRPSKLHVTQSTCGNTLCVAPGHLYWDTHKAVVKKMKIRGTLYLGGETCVGARNPMARSHTSEKLTPDVVTQIRNDPSNQKTIGLKYGVHQTTVSRIKRGTHWSVLINVKSTRPAE